MALPTGNRSEAYDLALFEPKSAKIVPLQPNKKQQKMERRRMRIHKVLNVLVTTAVASVVVGTVSLLVTSQVQLTEMNRTIALAEQQLGVLKSEQTRLEAELAQMLSAESADEYAQSQGMVDVDGSQIHYITRGDEDTVEVSSEGPQHWWDKLWTTIRGWFGG